MQENDQKLVNEVFFSTLVLAEEHKAANWGKDMVFATNS